MVNGMTMMKKQARRLASRILLGRFAGHRITEKFSIVEAFGYRSCRAGVELMRAVAIHTPQ